MVNTCSKACHGRIKEKQHETQHAEIIDLAHILDAVFTSGYIQTSPSKSDLMKQVPANSQKHSLLMC